MRLEEQIRVYFREFEETLPEVSSDLVADQLHGGGRVRVEWPGERRAAVRRWPRPLVAVAAALAVLVVVGGQLVGVRLFGGEDQRYAEVFFSSETGVARYPEPYSLGSSAAVGMDGSLWVVGDGVVFRFDGKTWTSYGPEDGLLPGSVNAVEVAPDGTVWVIQSGGVLRLERDGWTTLVGTRGWEQVAAPASDGSLWAVNRDRLFRLSEKDAYRSYPLDLASWETVVGLAVGPDGLLWVYDTGLRSFDGQTWNSYPMPSGLLPPGAGGPLAVQVAPDGSVWASLGGLIRIGPSEPSTWDYCPFETDRFGHMPVTRLCQTGGGGGVYGQGMGVVRFDGATWTYFGEDDGLYQGFPTDIAIAADGTVWAASPGVWAATGGDDSQIDLVGGGLFSYTDGRWEKVLEEPVSTLATGPDGEVWARTTGPGPDQWIRLVP